MSQKKTRSVESTSAMIDGVSPLLLGNCSHLSGIATTDLVELSRRTSCRMVFEGETLFGQGDEARAAYLLLDGGFRLQHRAETGLTGEYEQTGAYTTFGDLALMGETRRHYTATAIQDSIVLEMPVTALVQVLRRNDPAAIAWRGAIMARLHRRQPELAMSIPGRILGKLAELFEAA